MLAAALAAGSISTAAWAGDPSRFSEASRLSTDGSIAVMKGSVTGITGSGEFVVTSAEVVADGTVWVLKGAANAVEVMLHVPKAIAGGVSVAVGQSVTLVANGAGWLVKSAGKVVGFIPNESGRALLHSERLPRAGAAPKRPAPLPRDQT